MSKDEKPKPHDVFESRFERRKVGPDYEYRAIFRRSKAGQVAVKEIPWQSHRGFLAELAVMEPARAQWLSGDEVVPTWALGG